MHRLTRFVLLIFVALGFALFIFYLPSLMKQSDQGGGKKHVLVAARHLKPGMLLKEEDIKTEPWPKKMVFEGVLSEEDQKAFIGKSLVASVEKGEPLTKQRFGAAKENDYEKIFTLDIKTLQGNLPDFHQGMHLDFILTRKADAASSSSKLLENIPVIGLQYDKNQTLKSISLGLSEKQTFALTSGMDMGQIHVVERGLKDGPANLSGNFGSVEPIKKIAPPLSQDVIITYGTNIASQNAPTQIPHPAALVGDFLS